MKISSVSGSKKRLPSDHHQADSQTPSKKRLEIDTNSITDSLMFRSNITGIRSKWEEFDRNKKGSISPCGKPCYKNLNIL